jgi:hypothetical protein
MVSTWSSSVFITVFKGLGRATIDGQDNLFLYGNEGELHETAFILPSADSEPSAQVVSGSGSIKQQVLASGALAMQYTTTGQTVLQIGPRLRVFILGEPIQLCCLSKSINWLQIVPPRTSSGFYTHRPREASLRIVPRTRSL